MLRRTDRHGRNRTTTEENYERDEARLTARRAARKARDRTQLARQPSQSDGRGQCERAQSGQRDTVAHRRQHVTDTRHETRGRLSLFGNGSIRL